MLVQLLSKEIITEQRNAADKFVISLSSRTTSVFIYNFLVPKVSVTTCD